MAELLFELDGHFVQHIFSAAQVLRGPVTIGTHDGGGTVTRDLGQHIIFATQQSPSCYAFSSYKRIFHKG